jgi:hypothetical protein
MWKSGSCATAAKDTCRNKMYRTSRLIILIFIFKSLIVVTDGNGCRIPMLLPVKSLHFQLICGPGKCDFKTCWSEQLSLILEVEEKKVNLNGGIFFLNDFQV